MNETTITRKISARTHKHTVTIGDILSNILVEGITTQSLTGERKKITRVAWRANTAGQNAYIQTNSFNKQTTEKKITQKTTRIRPTQDRQIGEGDQIKTRE